VGCLEKIFLFENRFHLSLLLKSTPDCLFRLGNWVPVTTVPLFLLVSLNAINQEEVISKLEQ